MAERRRLMKKQALDVSKALFNESGKFSVLKLLEKNLTFNSEDQLGPQIHGFSIIQLRYNSFFTIFAYLEILFMIKMYKIILYRSIYIKVLIATELVTQLNPIYT